jgi:arginine decarboxylase
MVPGQVITPETIDFMRKLDVKEIHGFSASLGLKLLKPSFLEAEKLPVRRPAVEPLRTIEKRAA